MQFWEIVFDMKQKDRRCDCRSFLSCKSCRKYFFAFPCAPFKSLQLGVVLWCTVVSSFLVRPPNECFSTLYPTRLCHRKVIMCRHNKLFLPSCTLVSRPVGLFSAFHFLCTARKVESRWPRKLGGSKRPEVERVKDKWINVKTGKRKVLNVKKN